MGNISIVKMILSLFFFCVCGIVTSSPVAEMEEERGLVGDIAMGILVGKIQEMLGITHYTKTQTNHRWHRRPSWGRNHDDSRPSNRRGETWSPPNPVLPVLPLRGRNDHHGSPHHHQVWRSPWRWAPWVF